MGESANEDIDRGTIRYFSNLQNYDPLTKEEEHELFRKYKENNDIKARDLLIKSNLRYACKLASDYRGYGLSFGELISEANNGLIKAIERFDTTQDVKVITYAKWYIIQSIQAAIDAYSKIPTDELPSDDTAGIRITDDILDGNGINNKKNQKFNDAIIDTVYEDKQPEYKKVIEQIMTTLSKRESEMIRMYYGVGYKNPLTLEEIGDRYNLTKERVRQIIEIAIRKVRSEAMLNDCEYLSK